MFARSFRTSSPSAKSDDVLAGRVIHPCRHTHVPRPRPTPNPVGSPLLTRTQATGHISRTRRPLFNRRSSSPPPSSHRPPFPVANLLLLSPEIFFSPSPPPSPPPTRNANRKRNSRGNDGDDARLRRQRQRSGDPSAPGRALSAVRDRASFCGCHTERS